jgi:hypothetical protein
MMKEGRNERRKVNRIESNRMNQLILHNIYILNIKKKKNKTKLSIRITNNACSSTIETIFIFVSFDLI